MLAPFPMWVLVLQNVKIRIKTMKFRDLDGQVAFPTENVIIKVLQKGRAFMIQLHRVLVRDLVHVRRYFSSVFFSLPVLLVLKGCPPFFPYLPFCKTRSICGK